MSIDEQAQYISHGLAGLRDTHLPKLLIGEIEFLTAKAMALGAK